MTTVPFRQSAHWALALAGTALAYAVAAWFALGLAMPPEYASPLFPSAGIALACVLTFGWRMLPGVALGSFAVHAMVAAAHGALGNAGWALAAALAAGATLQAALGTWLVRRYVAQPLTLSEPRDITVFFGLGAVVACSTHSIMAIAALHVLNLQPAHSLLVTWWIWSVGDMQGIFIGAPVALTLIGHPRGSWAVRRITVGLSLAMATVLITMGIKQVNRWEEARTLATFERDAEQAASSLASCLQYPLHALQALHGVFAASDDDVTREQMQRAAVDWLAPQEHLQAVGWSEFVARAQLPAFVARARAKDFADYHVFDRADLNFQPPADEAVLALRYIEPLQPNKAALGVNVYSIPASRTAVDTALRTGTPVATAGFRATQSTQDDTAVVIYRAVFRPGPPPSSERERRASAQGVVFVTLPMEAALQAFRSKLPNYLGLCLVDTDPDAQRRRLAGPVGCESRTADLQRVKPLTFAGRQWEARMSAARGDVPSSREGNALMSSLVGLVATAMLAGLLLAVTGRTRRTEAAVQDRTLALQREIVERERTEADLRASEQRFRNILNNVPIGVVYTDLHGNVKQVNPHFCELTGYDAEALITMNMVTLTHPEDRQQDIELAGQLVRGDIPMYRRQGRYLTSENRPVWVQSVVTLLRDMQGRPHRIVGVVEDITEHLRLADAERARGIAEAANLAKSEFLSRMSHELRTPLNAMLGFAQLLELDHSHPLPAAQRPWVAQIQSAGWHLLDMINDVLDLSRIESGTLNLQSDTVDLREIIAAARALVEQETQRRRLEITLSLEDNTSRVIGDATRIKQILINLLSNAVKYNNEGGHIRISAHVNLRDHVEITVTDTGMGMTPQQLSQLFQPFNRLGRERSALEGTGIGLVISQRLAELMGGALRAHSVVGEGSSFILSLPRAHEPEPPLPRQGETQPAPSDYHQRSVHYVEDNETNVEVMRGILSRRPQVRFEVSMTGLDGLASIRARRPDLILLDMHLPDIDGMELLRHLKADSSTASIPVVVVSADALADRIDTALQAGAQQYLTKPVSVAELLGVVDAVLDDADTRYG